MAEATSGNGGNAVRPGLEDPFVGVVPPGVTAISGDPNSSVPLGVVHPCEVELVERAVPKRRREFLKGRECARAALTSLGGPDEPILVGADREPLWPRGFVGSITHTEGLCGAAVTTTRAYAGLGIDVEPDSALEAPVVERVGSVEETEAAALVLTSDVGTAAHLVFSAKEAFYKCQFPLTRLFIGFDAVRIELGTSELLITLLGPVGQFPAGFGFRGRWRRRDGFFTTSVWLPAR